MAHPNEENTAELFKACRSSPWHKVLKAIDKVGPNFWYQNDARHKNMFHHICEGKNYDVGERMVRLLGKEKCRCVFIKTNDEQESALGTACRLGQPNMARLFIANRAPFYLSAYKRQRSPLHVATEFNHPSVMCEVLKHPQLDVNIIDMDGRTALHSACTFGLFEAASLLLGHSADASKKNALGSTPLHLAVMGPHARVVRLLLQKGPKSIDFSNRLKNTAVHMACFEGDKEMLRLLLLHKAKPDCPNEKGDTPLHITCKAGNPDLTSQLLAAKARTDVLNKENKTPLDLAKEGHDREVIELFRQHHGRS
ncbi:hypothetical protein ACOMHN_061816 [Nucella lapillus]